MNQTKIDLYREHRSDYVTPRKPVLVSVGPARYLAVEGKGPPGGDEFTAQVAALYGVAFTIKMAKKSAGRDYTVSKLEGLWWGGTDRPPGGKKEVAWQWKLLIRVPELVTPADVRQAVAALAAKGKQATGVMLETLDEGRCVQLLHVGPYTEEGPTIARMREFAQAQGVTFRGLHHEIYLSDPRRVAAAKLRTILRQPVS
jgi:hypothetical protein